MKFDFIIGNPPYQDERKGDSTTALPIYHNFMEASYEIGRAVELITPARFLFNAGRTPKQWNEKMLSDTHLKVMHFEKDASTIFSNTEIKGGVAITYHDQDKDFTPIGTFTEHPELNSILSKVFPYISKESVAQIAFVASKFNTANLFKDYPDLSGHERRMSSNVLAFDCFHDNKETNDIMIYGVYNKKRTGRYIAKKYVDTSDETINRFKVILPKADGNGGFGDPLTMPEVLPRKTGFTHTFLGFGGFETEYEANAFISYIKTRFARTLLSILKVTQDMNADKWKYVPLQNFTKTSDIDWSKAIPEIDRQLFNKYGFDDAERTFIAAHVKEMI